MDSHQCLMTVQNPEVGNKRLKQQNKSKCESRDQRNSRTESKSYCRYLVDFKIRLITESTAIRTATEKKFCRRKFPLRSSG